MILAFLGSKQFLHQFEIQNRFLYEATSKFAVNIFAIDSRQKLHAWLRLPSMFKIFN